jgi:imidazole glycerol phosphate synthase glutamine amidotransferase subunit
MTLAVIDYGAGNLRSVSKALDFIKVPNCITSSLEEVYAAEKIIFPGVGSFGKTMKSLKESGLDRAIKKRIAEGTPFLGICLGLQTLFEGSEESPGVEGLKIFKGKARKFRGSIKVPHTGWNTAEIRKESELLKGLNNLRTHFYFVHSYFVEPANRSIVLTTTNYGSAFTSAICEDNIFGVQFHPEKSGTAGLKILKNFVKIKC